MENDKKRPFNNVELIYAYTRKQAIEDGVLIDVSEIANEAGFVYPVALTAALWADINAIPKSRCEQDANGRLWDILWMGCNAIRRNKTSGSELHYQLIMHVGRSTYYTVKLVCGPGDDAEPVITLMCPNED